MSMKHRYIHLFLIAGLIILAGVIHWKPSTAIAGHTELVAPSPLHWLAMWKGDLFYPYSVIPSGIKDGAELVRDATMDPLVNDHYRDFDFQRFRLVKLTADRYQFVSYRKDNRIWWTRKRLLIPKGELLFTDGAIYARTRCGNRLSDQPMQPTSAEEPNSFEMPTQTAISDVNPWDAEPTEILSPIIPIQGTLNWPTTAHSATRPAEPLLFPFQHTQAPMGMGIAYGSPLSGHLGKIAKPDKPVIVQTPEPATGYFIFFGLLVIGFVVAKWKEKD